MNFSVIAACDEDWGIGKEGVIPWHYKEDFKFFKETTAGSTCFMGRKTYEEIAHMRFGKPELLPGRKCVIISTSPLLDERIEVCNNIHECVEFATSDNFFIGGRAIFEFGLKMSSCALITNIPGKFNCDVKFPFGGLKYRYDITNESSLSDKLTVTEYKRKLKADKTE